MSLESSKEIVEQLLVEINVLVQERDQQYKSIQLFLDTIKHKTTVSYEEIKTVNRLFEVFQETYDTIEQSRSYVNGMLFEKKTIEPIIQQVGTIKRLLVEQEKQLQQLSLTLNDQIHK